VFSPQLCYWRSLDHSQIDPRFLYYWLSGPEFFSQYASVKGQTDMADYVSLRDQRRMFVTLPPIGEQRAIAGVLGPLDDKIELNGRMNEALEELGRLQFRMLLDIAVAQRPLREAIDVNPSRALRSGAEAPYVDMAALPTSSMRVTRTRERAFTRGSRFKNGDVLLARITPCLENGKTAFVDFLGSSEVGWGSTEFIVLRSRDPLPAAFAYFLARTDAFRSYAIASMTGTSGRQRAVPDVLARFSVPVPEAEAAAAFGASVDPLLAKIKQNDEESRTLAELRDVLLPKLISGELRVCNAEAAVESAGV
jgi:type I restriction enzyme S subunit